MSSPRLTLAATMGTEVSGVTVAQTTRPISSGARPLRSSAWAAALVARSVVVSSWAMWR